MTATINKTDGSARNLQEAVEAVESHLHPRPSWNVAESPSSKASSVPERIPEVSARSRKKGASAAKLPSMSEAGIAGVAIRAFAPVPST